MNLLFDTCLWIDDLRRGTLGAVLPRVRDRFVLWMDSVAAGELLSGARTRADRRRIAGLLAPFERAGRIVTPNHKDYVRAAEALSRLRGGGVTLRNPAGAMFDALQAADSLRIGALLVTHNASDFRALRSYIPMTFVSFEEFGRRL